MSDPATTIHWATGLPDMHLTSRDNSRREVVDGAETDLILFTIRQGPAQRYAKTYGVRLFSREIHDHADGSQWRGPWQEQQP